MRKVKLIFILLFLSTLTCLAQVDTAQLRVTGRQNGISQQKKPYVILISADGFRNDYAEKYQAEHLLKLAAGGVKAKGMIPSFPSVTFPNHYTIITGLYPSHNGLVNNAFFDRSRKQVYSYRDKTATADGTWYGGTPLWVLAEQQHLLSASFYWVGSEAAIKGVRPTYYYNYNEKIPIGNRIQTIVNWLKLPPSKRPHFITFYLPQVDHAGHQYGPDAPETEKEVHFVDSAVYELTKAVKSTGLAVNYIFLSDHGMTKVDTAKAIRIPASIDTAKFRVMGDGTLVELYAKSPQDIVPTYQSLKNEATGYSVYLKENMPAYLHYNKTDDRYNRIGDILLIPEWPLIFNLYNRRVSIGAHGYDPAKVPEMLATFYAWGPAFEKHLVINKFQNVNVYPIITEILGLHSLDKIDGTRKTAGKILRKYSRKSR